MNRISRIALVTAVVAVITTSCPWSLSAAQDSAPARSTPPVTLHGRVTDTDGRPIADAKVTVIGLHHSPFLQDAFAGLGSVSARTNVKGEFQTSFQRSDHRFRQSDRVLLAVQAQGKRLRLVNVKHQRSLAGPPLNVQLPGQDDLQLQVVDAAGEPISGVTLSPAAIGSLAIPYKAIEAHSQPTDETGFASLAGVTRASLIKVYAVSEAIGHQCLAVTATPVGTLQAVALETHLESGRVKFVDPSPPTDLGELSMTLIAVASAGNESPYTWCDADVADDGTFSGCRLSAGMLRLHGHFPSTFPYAFDSTAAYGSLRPPSGQILEIDLFKATRVVGKLIDAHSGEPIPNVLIQHHATDNRQTISDSEGVFQYWAGPGRIGYYPQDVFQQYILGGAFYLYPQKLPENGVLQLDPVQMQPMSASTGIVTDETGKPVASARINCSFKKERFTYDQPLFSDSEGKFRFYGVLEGTGVSLTAQTDLRISRAPVSLQLSPDASPELVVSPRHALRFRGRIVDDEGRGVTDARIQIRTGKVHEEEAYGGRGSSVINFFDDNTVIETDAEGGFMSPPTLEWDRAVSISATAPGHRPLQTYWKDASPAGREGHDFDFGTLTLRPRTAYRTREIKVVDDETGDPIAGAKVVSLGARTSRVAGITDDSGIVRLSLRGGRQILAANQGGYTPSIQVIESIDSVGPIRLAGEGEQLPDRTPVVHNQDELKRFAAALLQKVPPPGKKASFHQKRCYGYCLAFADFDAALKLVTSMSESLDAEMLGSVVSRFDWLDRAETERVMPMLDSRARSYKMLGQAKKTDDADEREALIGESLVVARDLKGDEHLYAIAQISETLLSAGEVELAIELLEEAWDEHGELAKVLEKGERSRKMGIARIFAPLYALVDAEAAMKLIELTAYAAEIERLQTKALVYLAVFDPKKFNAVCQQRQIEQLSSLGINQFYSGFKVTRFNRGMEVASRVPATPGKAQFLFDLICNATDATDQQRVAVARQLLELLYDHQPEASMTHVSQLAAQAARRVARWDRQLAEEFAFASIWLCEREGTILPFNLTSTLAQELALYDTDLARALVEPCFDDWSWLFGERDHAVIFTRNRPLAAAATIDPAWAIELTGQLIEQHLGAYPSRQYETVYGVIDRWTEIPVE